MMFPNKFPNKFPNRSPEEDDPDETDDTTLSGVMNPPHKALKVVKETNTIAAMFQASHTS